ncbi:MAG TPA: SRPBCC family protein [Vicinamibacterales bacterium]|nr:SRPBCC family protein [Vicinamibacterales bacterium]
MTTVTITSHITAPVDHVFSYFTDLEHLTERVHAIKKVEVLTQGDFNLRTRWRETRHVLGRDLDEEMEVTAFDRNRSYTITADDRGARMDTIFSFEPCDGGTDVTMEFNFDTRTLPARLMAPIGWAMKGKIRDALTHDLDDLRQAIEGTEPAGIR